MIKKTRLIKDFSYPLPNDPELLSKIYKKREFYYNRVPKRNKLTEYEDIEKYRAANCKAGEIEPREQQIIIPNYINPNTPYKGVILIHGVGSGKTMTAIRVAEQFKEQVKKYNTKIYVLVPGANTKENFKNELLDTTGTTYFKNKDEMSQLTKQEIQLEENTALYNALSYYKILSYKTFHKKVLGEKILEKKIVGETKLKSTYRKNAEGEIEREIVIDKITNMNNTILIVDEAHNLSGNEYGDALKKIIKNSENLRVVLLTATPMINLADEIIDLLNFIRPENDQVQRDKVFSGDKNYQMKIKPDGLEYLKKMARGYVSYYRGSIPYTFADRVEHGTIPNGMLFTPVIQCKMNDFQHKAYLKTKDNTEDSLDKNSVAAANFVFPGLNKEKTEIIGYYSTEGINTILSQLASDGPKLRSLINKQLFNSKLSKEDESNFIIENDKKNIKGLILTLEYLKYFSIKFYTIITKLNKLFEDKEGCATAFIYSNLVKAGGIELFAESLIQNGYLEYQDDSSNYDIKDDTIDYKTGLTYLEFKKRKLPNFSPATFIMITGGSEEGTEDLPEVKQKQIKNVFNNADNIDGKNIKLVLGSRVMNEGVTLKNVKEVHIIDPFFNIPKAEQVIGRAIRMCVHKDSINENNKFPKVDVFRYVVSIGKELSSDELLYQKAELKYLTIKDIEYSLKQVALDCPLLLHSNVFPEEIDKYKNCVYPTLENVKEGKQICPALCDFRKCEFKCETSLNEKYWDNEKKTYKNLDKNDINYNTFNDRLASNEINMIKNKIKDLYRFKHVYTYNEILEDIKKSFIEHQSELFEQYFLDQALEDLMPKTQNDFNTFKDIIYDKYNKSGYLIQRNKYYIFQPINENEDLPMYYRQKIDIEQNNKVSINNYINEKYDKSKLSIDKNKDKDKDTEKIINKPIKHYDFDSIMNYYEERNENFIVGIIDKNKSKNTLDNEDIFKIRNPMVKITDKKRGIGIPTLKGSVCVTAKSKDELLELLNKLPNTNYKKSNTKSRDNLCNDLKEILLLLEKYSTTKDGNKKTYIMIPANHPKYPFPYNLEDRIKHIITSVNTILQRKIDIIVKKQKDKDDNAIYELSFENEKKFENVKDIEKLGFVLKNNLWLLNIS